MAYDFRNLSLTQKTILAAGGYRPGEKLEGRPHRFPTECALQTLVKRGFLRESEGGAFAVPSDVAAAFRTIAPSFCRAEHSRMPKGASMSARIRLTPYNRSKAVDMVRSAPDGYLFMPPREPTRSTAQNARLWAMLTDISKQVVWTVNGHAEKLSPEDWKAIISASLAQENRMAPGVRGGFVMLGTSTRSMTIRQMTEMIDFAQAFGDDQGVQWSEPAQEIPEQYRESAHA